MKVTLASLILIPAVMGRACKFRHSHSSVVPSASAIAVESPVSSVAQPSATYINSGSSSGGSASSGSSSSSSSSAAAAASSSTSSGSSSGSTGESVEFSSAAISGTSTFYGGNLNGGNCMFTTYTLPSGIYGTAYSGAKWNNAADCGACIQVTGPSGKTIKAMIVDQCPECDAGHLDLFQDAFSAVGGTDGTVSTSYTFVPCDITSPLILHNKSGTSTYWFSMQVVNHNKPVKSLEVSTDGGSTWKSTTRSAYNFFENPSGFGAETMSIRVTSTSGESVVVSNVGVTADAQYTATSNF